MSEKKPQLRTDLKISRHIQGENVHYVIKDPLTQEYFRFPEDKFEVIRLFDGANSFELMVKKYNQDNTDAEIDLETVKQFFETLEKSHLLKKSLAEQNLFLLEKMREQRKSALLGAKGSLMYFRISLLDPEMLLRKTYPYLTWLYKPPFLIFATLCISGAIGIIIQNYDRFLEGISSIITFTDKTPSAIFGLWATVVLIIFFHELGHAYTCKHFGGEVHEMGVLMLFFMPCFFANVNDAWTFEKKYQKIAVTFAGGLTEFFIGSIATFFWFFLNPASAGSGISYQIMTICAFSSVMMNFNPLMKLDGYYAFSDFFGIPNLKTESASYVKYNTQKYLFRMNPEDTFESYSRREKQVLLGYGIACVFYMVGVMSGLFFMLRGLLVDNFGLIGAFLSLWVAWKLFKGYVMKLKGFFIRFYTEKLAAFRKHPAVIISIVVFIIAMGIYGFAEHVLVIEKKCTLLPTRTSKIFTGESGYLTSHTIAVGRRIVPHEKIGVLTNLDKEETRALESINYKLKKITKSAAMRDHDISGGIEAAIALDRVRKTLEKTIRELEACTLRIAQEGIIISSQARKGYCPYFTKGSELCEIAPIDSFIIELNMLESEIGEIKQGDRAEVKLWSMMRVKLNGIVQSTAPVTLSYEKESKNAEAKSKGVEKEFKVSIVVSNIATKKVSPYMSGMVRVYAGDMRGFRLIMKMIRSALRTDLFF